MKAIATLYGGWNTATNKAAGVLSKNDFAFRVCLSHDSPGTPVLRMPFHVVRGLENIREFAEKSSSEMCTAESSDEV